MSAPAKKDRASKRQFANPTSPLSNMYAFVLNNIATILLSAVIVIVGIFSYVIYKSGQFGIKNLINAKPDVLKDAIFGDNPHLFYCHTGKGGVDPVVPPLFSELNKLRGSKMDFALLNCR